MSTSIQALLAKPELLTLSAPQASKGGIKICALKHDSKPVTVKLAEDLTSASTPFAPSVFGGGEADRKGILFNISEQAYEDFYALEQLCIKQLQEHVPDIMRLWRSPLTPADKFSASLKAKINTGGDRKVKYFNAENEPTEEPESWRRLPVNAVIAVRGCYLQKMQAGLLLDVTHVQLGDLEESAPENSPFL